MATGEFTDRFSEEQATYAVRGKETPDLEKGAAAIRNVVKTLPARPGHQLYAAQQPAEALAADGVAHA